MPGGGLQIVGIEMAKRRRTAQTSQTDSHEFHDHHGLPASRASARPAATALVASVLLRLPSGGGFARHRCPRRVYWLASPIAVGSLPTAPHSRSPAAVVRRKSKPCCSVARRGCVTGLMSIAIALREATDVSHRPARTADRSPTAHRLTASDPHKDLPLQLSPSSQHAFHNECNGPPISKLNRHAAPVLVLQSRPFF